MKKIEEFNSQNLEKIIRDCANQPGFEGLVYMSDRNRQKEALTALYDALASDGSGVVYRSDDSIAFINGSEIVVDYASIYFNISDLGRKFDKILLDPALDYDIIRKRYRLFDGGYLNTETGEYLNTETKVKESGPSVETLDEYLKSFKIIASEEK